MKHIAPFAARTAALTLSALASLICAACASSGGAIEEPTVIEAPAAAEAAAEVEDAPPAEEEASKQEEGEVPIPVAETEHPEATPETPKEIVIQGSRARHDAIHDLVAEAQTLLRDVDLQYVLTGKGRSQILRGRPVAF